jgi:hypothetical protein
MAGSSRFSIRSVLDEMRNSPGPRYVVFFALAYLVCLFAMVFWGTEWDTYKGLFGLWFLIYLLLLFSILRSGLLKKMEKMNPAVIMAGIFILGLLLHLPFLLRDPSMSQDIMRLERRGELLLDGQFPYRDFDVNKPPLYIWMAGALSLPFGPDQQIFRIFFATISSLVPVVMFLIHRKRTGPLDNKDDGIQKSSISAFGWFGGAVGYLLCPILLLETGLAGHFDPVVILTTVLSFYFLSRKRPAMSGFMLGTGLALKLYPMFIAPLFFLSFPKWKDRLLFILGMVLPTLLSTIPLLVVDPFLVIEYLTYQFHGWPAGISLRGGLEGVLGVLGLPMDVSFYMMTGTLLFAIIFFSIRGIMGGLRRSDALWVGAGMFLFSSMGVMLSTIYLINRDTSTPGFVLGWAGTILSILFSGAGVYIFLHWEPSRSPAAGGMGIKELIKGSIHENDLPFLVACTLIVLVLTSAQFHPWYIGWVVPFLLASGSTHLTWSLLLLLSTFQLNGYLPWDI